MEWSLAETRYFALWADDTTGDTYNVGQMEGIIKWELKWDLLLQAGVCASLS